MVKHPWSLRQDHRKGKIPWEVAGTHQSNPVWRLVFCLEMSQPVTWKARYLYLHILFNHYGNQDNYRIISNNVCDNNHLYNTNAK